MPEPKLGGRAVGQGVVRDASSGVLAQVLVERSDGLRESAFLDVFLTDQELGLGTGRTRCRFSQAGEHRIGPVGLSRAAIGERKIVTSRGAGGLGKLVCSGPWLRASRAGDTKNRLENRDGVARLPTGQQRSGFDQPDVGLKRTVGKPAANDCARLRAAAWSPASRASCAARITAWSAAGSGGLALATSRNLSLASRGRFSF